MKKNNKVFIIQLCLSLLISITHAQTSHTGGSVTIDSADVIIKEGNLMITDSSKGVMLRSDAGYDRTVLKYGADSTGGDDVSITNREAGGNIIFQTSGENGGAVNEQTFMTITDSGNVGIGTYYPCAKLEIFGAGNTDATHSFIIEDSTASSLFTVRDDGNVGIGTGVPEYLLDVNGIARVNEIKISDVGYIKKSGASYFGLGHNSSGDHILMLHTNNTVFYQTAQFKRSVVIKSLYSNTGGAVLQVKNNDDDIIIYVNDSGSVGIGTSSPVGELDVNGTIRATNLIVNGDTLGGGGVWTDSSTFISYTAGNVGIGTITPSYKLDVSGAINASNFLLNGDTISFNSLWTQDTTQISYTTGSVGIGTDSIPEGYLLAVNGGIIAERITGKIRANWPDYVFSDNYVLTPLSEVEQYITKNKHLSGVPSAEELAETGVDIVEMESNILQKVEELTLYIIAQDKKLVAQQKMLEEQQVMIQQLLDQ